MAYVIYVNFPNSYVSAHDASGCGYVKMHGGVSSTTPPTGYYIEGFRTVEDVRAAAKVVQEALEAASHRGRRWDLRLHGCL